MSTTLSACETLEKQAYILLYSRVLGLRSEDGVKLVEATMRDVVDGTILFRGSLLSEQQGDEGDDADRARSADRHSAKFKPAEAFNRSRGNTVNGVPTPSGSTGQQCACRRLSCSGMHSDVNLEVLSVTEGKQAPPVDPVKGGEVNCA